MADQPAQANPQHLMAIGAVAAHNIAASLNLDTKHVGLIEQSIKDEINAMSSHFTLAMADIQTQYEVEVGKIKSTFNYVNANWKSLIGAVIGVFVVGVLVGLLV